MDEKSQMTLTLRLGKYKRRPSSRRVTNFFFHSLLNGLPLFLYRYPWKINKSSRLLLYWCTQNTAQGAFRHNTAFIQHCPKASVAHRHSHSTNTVYNIVTGNIMRPGRYDVELRTIVEQCLRFIWSILHPPAAPSMLVTVSCSSQITLHERIKLIRLFLIGWMITLISHSTQ